MTSEELIISHFDGLLFKRDTQWYINNLDLLNLIIAFCQEKRIAIISIETFKYYSNNGISTLDIQNYSFIASDGPVLVNKNDWNDYVLWTLNKTLSYGNLVPFHKNIILELFVSSELERTPKYEGPSNYQLWQENKISPVWD